MHIVNGDQPMNRGRQAGRGIATAPHKSKRFASMLQIRDSPVHVERVDHAVAVGLVIVALIRHETP